MTTVSDIIRLLDARLLCGDDSLGQEVDSACGSDLMSDVLAFVKGRTALITGLTNIHVIRTAEMLDIHCIIFARGKVPGDDVLKEAEELGITVLTTRHTTYTTCGILYEAGIRGNNERVADKE